jgi:S-adenosylmethionine:tRNA ribosyltransferase-isomerase
MVADRLITNFHDSHSTLLMAVAAFGDFDFVRHAYDVAIKEKYRFMAYGDAMLII